MPRKLTQEEFITSCKNVWGDRFDLSLAIYVDSNSPVTIICREHGKWRPRVMNLLSGHGCPECARKIYQTCKLSNTEDFIRKAKAIHRGKYDYSKVEYIGSKVPITIICPTHGEFQQRPNDHLSGKGCRKCYGNSKMTKDEFVNKAEKVHGNKYDYSHVEISGNNKSKVEIICTKHGSFWQSPNQHLRGVGCPACSSSRGETMIQLYLDEHNVRYERWKVFDDCRNIKVLPFDFYLPELHTCIEFQGVQHYKAIDFFGGDEALKSQKRRDAIKRDYCSSRGLILIEIYDKNNIENILNTII